MEIFEILTPSSYMSVVRIGITSFVFSVAQFFVLFANMRIKKVGAGGTYIKREAYRFLLEV